MNHFKATIPSRKVLLLKQIDVVVQCILIPGAIVYALGNGSGFNFIFSYFIVGGWQLTSCITHLFLRQKFLPSRERAPYTQAVGLFIGIAVICLLAVVLQGEAGDFVLLYFIILLVVTPLLAFKYLAISIVELRRLNTYFK